MRSFRTDRMAVARPGGRPGSWVEIDGLIVTPGDDDEYVTVRALDLVGKTMRRTDVLGATATAHLDGGFVVIQYDGMPTYHRTLIRSDAYVRVKRHA